MSEKTITYWRGKPVTELSREELIAAVEWLGERYMESLSPQNTLALGQIEMMRRGEDG